MKRVAGIALVLVATGCGGHATTEGPIRIGVLSDCAGELGPAYHATIAGAERPLLKRGGRLAGPLPTDGLEGVSIGGRPVRLVFGCADGTAASALIEARRLVEKAGVDVLIGPLAGDEELVLQDYAGVRPETAFVNGASSAQLLHPAPNFFSFHIDGAQSMAGLGAYAYRRLGWRTAVTIADANDAFEWAQTAGFVAEFCSLGGTISGRIWVQPETQARPPPRADGYVVVSGAETVLALARGSAEPRGNLARKLIVGSSVDAHGLRRLGGRVTGVVSAGPIGGSRYDVFYHDAMVATLTALDRVGGDLSGGERRFLAALARVRLDSAAGRVRLDARHRAIAPNRVTMLTSGLDRRVLRTIPGVEPTFGGFFTPDDPLPGETTPACKRGHAPPWVRSD